MNGHILLWLNLEWFWNASLWENTFGWRIIQAILGVGAVFLIYLISKELFKDKLLSVLSAAVFSLDGLPLVMSRIGMNDTYMLFLCFFPFIYLLERRISGQLWLLVCLLPQNGLLSG